MKYYTWIFKEDNEGYVAVYLYPFSKGGRYLCLYTSTDQSTWNQVFDKARWMTYRDPEEFENYQELDNYMSENIWEDLLEDPEYYTDMIKNLFYGI